MIPGIGRFVGFLAPLFLLGGLLAALPVVLHLTRRRREPIAFPSFLLLGATSAAARWKRRRFRNIPLLILRCLAILLLASAFAQPRIEAEGAGAFAAAPLDLAVLVDRSLSMGVEGRMEEALRTAGEELDQLGRDDRAVIVAFADRAEALTELTGDLATLRQALSELAAGEGGTRFPSALGLSGRLLPETPGRRREAVLFSDLQRSGFEAGRPESSLPAGVGLRVRRIGSAPPPNASILEVRLTAVGREEIAVTAEVRFAPSPAVPERTATMQLLLSGRVAERRSVELIGDRAITVQFAPVLRPSEPLAAEVRLEADALSGDDGFRFVIHPETAIRLVDFGGPQFVYVREALAVSVEPAFLLEQAPARGEAALRQALRGTQVALVRDPGALDAGAARALSQFVSEGGGLVMAMGPRRGTGAAASAFPDLLPAASAGFVDREPAGRLADLSIRHPIFEPFVGEGALPLADTAFFRYRALPAGRPGVEILAYFDDGRPAILAAPRGAGRAFVFASSFGGEWNDLPRRPAFVPFLHRLIEVAADYREVPLAFRVGDSVDPAAAFRLAPSDGRGPSPGEPGELLLESPSGARSVLRGASALRLEQAGFFRARRPGSAEFREIAVNPPPSESDLRVLDADEVRIGAAAPPVPANEESAAAGIPPAGFPAWRLLLAGFGLLLAAEAWAANRRESGARSYTGP